MLELMLEEILFYFFSSVALVAALMVVIAKHPVRAVLSLVLCFFATGALWLLLESEFLALTLVLVYVGAVMVLFLFVVMTLDIELATLSEGFQSFLPLGIAFALLVAAGLILALSHGGFTPQRYPKPVPYPLDYSQVTALGELLYSRYLVAFEVAGFLLLIAIVTAISLCYRGRRKSKLERAVDQVSATKANRLRILQMQTEKVGEGA